MSSVFPARPVSSLEQLSTPCLVLERGKLARNLARMAATVAIRILFVQTVPAALAGIFLILA